MCKPRQGKGIQKLMETPATIVLAGERESLKSVRMAAVAWILTSVYYFYQYALRSAPAVMMPELSNAFGITPLALASLVGLFYYGYSPFSLVAGAAMDRIGPRRLLPGAAAVVGIGALLFATVIVSLPVPADFYRVPAVSLRLSALSTSRQRIFHRQAQPL